MKDKKEKYQLLRKEGKLQGTIKDALQIASKRAQRKNFIFDYPVNIRKKRVKAVQVGILDNRKILNKWQNLHPRRSNWDDVTGVTVKNVDKLETLSHGKYSRSCSYERKSYQPIITSYAYIQDDHLVYTFAEKTTILHQPKGCKWSFDESLNLFCLSNKRGEIHLNSDTLNNYSKRKIQKSLTEVYEARKAIKKAIKYYEEVLVIDKKLEQKENANKAFALSQNIFVSIEDAYTAGSCKAGVLACLQKEKLKGSHFRIKTINRLFGGQYKDHVSRLICVAIDRHKKEDKEGFCVI